MREQFITFIEKIDIHESFLRIAKRFITACGITLLLCFFNEDIEVYTRESIVRVVFSIFLLECLLSIFYKATKYTGTVAPNAATWQDTAMASLAEESTQKIDKNRQIIAVHEAGHAVMSYLVNATRYDIDIANSCVHTSYGLADIEEYKNYIMVTYAGAASEELILGKYCSGCFGSGTADFEFARTQIKGYIVMTDNTVSKSMLEEEIGQKVIRLSKDLYLETLEALAPHKDMIQHLADILSTKNSLKTEEVKEILEHYNAGKEGGTVNHETCN